jgi:hypothetical protein
MPKKFCSERLRNDCEAIAQRFQCDCKMIAQREAIAYWLFTAIAHLFPHRFAQQLHSDRVANANQLRNDRAARTRINCATIEQL